MHIIYLTPRSGYVTDLRSDTLWGSICWGIRYLYGEKELEDFLERCAAGKPDFVISSTFPYKTHGKDRMPFFPNPLILSPEADTQNEDLREAYRLRKELKKVNFLNLDDFKAALHGELSAQMLLARIAKERMLKKEAKDNYTVYTPLPETVTQNQPKQEVYSMTHNTIDRLRGGTLNSIDGDGNSAGQLFHAEDIWWLDPDNESDASNPNTGLFFLAYGDVSKLKPVLELLRHWGIGADRTAGKGSFNVDIADFSQELSSLEPNEKDANAMINLSLFRPTREELGLLEKAGACRQYLLERREGYVGGLPKSRRKQARIYFREGSVFLRPEGLKNRFHGGIDAEQKEDLPHPVWSNGFGLMLNLKWHEQ